MKQKNNIIYTLAVATLLLMFAGGCKKDDGSAAATTVIQLAPIVTSSAISFNVVVAGGKASGSGGGNISGDGGAAVTARGVCWSLAVKPTIADNKTADGAGTGIFTSQISPLNLGTLYHVRAYATNSVGTSYGDDLTLIALAPGQLFAGGIVGYILKEGDPGYKDGEVHGLAVETKFNTTIVHKEWTQKNSSGEYLKIATKTGMGTGAANTAAIVGNNTSVGAGTYFAASYCSTLELNGYTDWFLPSKDELNAIYKSYPAYAEWATPAYESYFWSSSDISDREAWIQSFYTGVQSTYFKGGSMWSRAVRAF